MLETFIISWILTWFNLDNLITTGINEIFNTNFTIAIYWVITFVIAVIITIIAVIKD